ncbi:MAG: hypothetical protein ACT4O2_10630 [Beijerinckiaceae bacterium]
MFQGWVARAALPTIPLFYDVTAAAAPHQIWRHMGIILAGGPDQPLWPITGVA